MNKSKSNILLPLPAKQGSDLFLSPSIERLAKQVLMRTSAFEQFFTKLSRVTNPLVLRKNQKAIFNKLSQHVKVMCHLSSQILEQPELLNKYGTYLCTLTSNARIIFIFILVLG